MENIRLVKSKSKYFICDEIKLISTDRSAIKEMGEPFIFDESQTWVFAYRYDQMVGFICYNLTKILYVYVLPEFRKRGIFTELYNELPPQKWEVVASNASYELFIKKGFEVVKNYKNCHKLIKK